MAELGLHLAGSRLSVSAARSFVRSTLYAWRLPDLGDTAELLAGEIVGNAVRHAGAPVEVRVRTTDAGVRVEVDDPSTRRPVLQVREGASTGGVGLNLVDAFANRWGADVRDAGKTVWFELDVPTHA